MAEAKLSCKTPKGDQMAPNDIKELFDRVGKIEAISEQNNKMLSRLFEKFDNIETQVVRNTVKSETNSRFIYGIFGFLSLVGVAFFGAIMSGNLHLSTASV